MVRSSAVKRIIDLRSDTVTRPCRAMLETALTAVTGDDVMQEDPTVRMLETAVAERLGKTHGLYFPTGTMANLCALSAHCDRRAMEVLVGQQSHICLYEGGNISTTAGIHSRQVAEDTATAEFSTEDLFVRKDNDDHYCQTKVLCLENTHNMLGGIPLRSSYIGEMGTFCRDHDLKLHIDGARIANAVVATNEPASEVCAPADSISVCLSKGLGAPMGTVLVSDDAEFRRLAKRARKRYGGGMRQAGVVAAMGLYAVEHNWDRIQEDHERAQDLYDRLQGTFVMMGVPRTNMVYFRLPDDAVITEDAFGERLKQSGILLIGGYSQHGNVFRAVTHLDLQDDDIADASATIIEALQ